MGVIIKYTYVDAGGSSDDVSYRISKPKQSFDIPLPVWKSTAIPKSMKLKMVNYCIKSVLLYAGESGSTTDHNTLHPMMNFEDFLAQHNI